MDYIIIFACLLYFYYPLTNSLHMLQQNSYNKDWAYLKWVKKKLFNIWGSFNIIQFILLILTLIIKSDILLIIIIISYLGLFLINYFKSKKNIVKEPLVYTPRIKRLIISTIIIYGSISFLISYFLKINISIPLIFISYFQYLLILIILIINKPVEKMVYLKFKYQARNKLKSMPFLKTIGITGSYGKTSIKNILNEIMNIKYNPLPTPKNFNTPNGLLITINNHLNKFHNVFIAEMGARNKGEIKELCDLVNPTYGILTTIGTAHLESFGSRETIQKTKFELIESLPDDGIGVLNADDNWQTDYKLKTKAKIIWIGINNNKADYIADDIKITNEGITFDLKIKNDKNKYNFKSKLLGHANVYNLLASIALSYELGISIPDLQKAVKKVNPAEHRLELKNMGDFIIIDDAYNASPSGNKMALDVLALMPGKKIIVTSSMVELGKIEKESNYEYGKDIAKVCDEVILLGDKQTLDIQLGLKENKYNEKNIHIIENINDAFELINKLKDKNTYILLKNDLTDIYK